MVRRWIRGLIGCRGDIRYFLDQSYSLSWVSVNGLSGKFWSFEAFTAKPLDSGLGCGLFSCNLTAGPISWPCRILPQGLFLFFLNLDLNNLISVKTTFMCSIIIFNYLKIKLQANFRKG